MARALGAVVLVVLYLLVGVAPLSFMFLDTSLPRRPFSVELSAALGFVGLSMMGLQFALVARFRAMAAPFGIVGLHRFHKQVSALALVFILAHPALLIAHDSATYLRLLNVAIAPSWARFGIIAGALLLLLAALSVLRKRLRIRYQVWQVSHGVLALAVVGFALAHINGVGHYTRGPLRQGLFDAMSLSMVGLLLWTRILTPLFHLRRAWRVVSLWPERARSYTLVIEPEGHRGFTFRPGQFAWLSRWPLAVAQQPFSFSSPSEGRPGRLSITIKALGEWSDGRGVLALRPGRRVYLDGPHGEFSMDLYEAPGYVFVAAGEGIVPLYSMVSTMCVREDVRPAVLFYSSRDWESVMFREQLEELQLYMPNLKVVHVLSYTPSEWLGERGRITAQLLYRHLPRRQYTSFEYFVCGPDSFLDPTEEALSMIGVSETRIHTQRLGIV
ncbi:MAG: ferric reductase-like transmembrane domain-containing protein [Candidatus Dormibacteraeota bacterium]|nr:ferric reductase-like transmembrane domain-containing protein [Candidatus Dormibacteraeota bacterium]